MAARAGAQALHLVVATRETMESSAAEAVVQTLLRENAAFVVGRELVQQRGGPPPVETWEGPAAARARPSHHATDGPGRYVVARASHHAQPRKTHFMPQQTGRWHHLYNTRRWQRRAKLQIREFPLCSMCLVRNVVTPATVADHITPHHGDHQLFYFGELQSLCQHCHSSRKKQLETYGYQRDVGIDGWPIDPNHPANRRS